MNPTGSTQSIILSIILVQHPIGSDRPKHVPRMQPSSKTGKTTTSLSSMFRKKASSICKHGHYKSPKLLAAHHSWGIFLQHVPTTRVGTRCSSWRFRRFPPGSCFPHSSSVPVFVVAAVFGKTQAIGLAQKKTIHSLSRNMCISLTK